ncbi:MAG: PKD domain-containing protein [Desulfobulbaceae bacterium]
MDQPDGEVLFTITAIFQDGTESLHSAPFSYIFSTTLKAQLTAVPLEGQTPLPVAFDASSSTGTILSHDWAFGDGNTAAGNTASYIYATAGNYTVTLKVTDNIGAIDRETVSVMATSASALNNPPVAVISSSSSVGDAPLDVAFDGSGSSDSDGTILAYYWDLGDGGTASGALAANTYISSGTFYSALTVTDDGGLPDSSSTPIIVSRPPAEENIPPDAVISASASLGTAPLTVAFNALASTDPDGEINSYAWNFGDGTIGAGVNVEHLFIEPGIFIVMLKVTDNMGASSNASYSVIIKTGVPEPPFTLELGTISAGSTWSRINLNKEFIQPIVLASPASYNDTDPAVVRIKNVDASGFDIRVQEWDYLDDTHTEETIHYLVMEQGSYILDNGARLEAGSFSANTQFQSLPFSSDFQSEPIVIASIMTTNEEDAVTGRIRKLSDSKFDFRLSEQESSRSGHAVETVGYIAWEPGIGSIGSNQYEVGKTENAVTDLWHYIDFQTGFVEIPYFFAAMQSYDSGENSTVRYQYLAPADVQVSIEEEASKDSETAHTTEVVGYITFSSDI